MAEPTEYEIEYNTFLLESLVKLNVYMLKEEHLNSKQRKEISWIKERLNIE